MLTELTLFFQDVASHLVASVVERSLSTLARTSLTSTWALHRRDLMEKVKDMPFIYKDLEGDVINDFVDPDLRSLDIESLSPMAGRPNSIHGRIRERIRDHKRLLVLGEAGIGKTTFLRFEILSLLKAKGRLDHYIDGERLLPFYVPLKGLDNTSPFPILRYLLSNNLYLRRNGLKRLLKLGNKHQLFLFLDGYDEIQTRGMQPGGQEDDYLSAEFGYLLHSGSLGLASNIPSQYRAFYAAAQRCRIWLSSRREFFLLDPISLRDDLPGGGVSRAMAMQLTGIGNSRHRLADTIFNKYRGRSHKYRELLSAEYFVQEIDRSPDYELVKMSYNPLFLTVMAYIYAGKAIDRGTHDVTFGQNLRELVLECISLLLIDLDEYKARGLPAAHKLALLRRRNDYVDEKKAFLFYFASRLLYEGRNVFDLAYIRQRAIHFFKVEYTETDCQVIVRGLEGTGGASADIALQLIYAGLFVMVDRTTAGVVTYDFPHRRFREVLASQYFDERDDRMATLGWYLDRPSLAESLYVFFSISRFKGDILHAILSRVRGAKEPRYGDILLHTLESPSEGFNASPIIWEFLLHAIRDGQTFSVPIGLLRFVKKEAQCVERVVELLDAALKSGQVNSVSLGCSLLGYLDKGALAESLFKALSNAPKEERIDYLIYRSLWVTDRNYCIEHLEDLTRDRRLAAGLYLAIAEDSAINDKGRDICAEILSRLPPSKNAVFFLILERINPKLVSRLLGARALSRRLERLLALTRTNHEPAEELYAVTHDVVDASPEGPVRKALNERVGSAFLRVDIEEFLLDMPRPGALIRKMHIPESMRKWAFGLREALVVTKPEIPEYFYG